MLTRALIILHLSKYLCLLRVNSFHRGITMNLIKNLKSLGANKNIAKVMSLFANKNIAKGMFTLVLGMFMAVDLIAGSGTAFQSIWDTEITALLEGEPAKIIAALILLMSLYQGIMKQNYVTALGFFIACIFMSYASEIIDSFFSGGFAL